MNEDHYPTPPKSIREYIEKFAEYKKVICWIWENVITRESRVWIFRLIGLLFVRSALMTVDPFLIAQMINQVLLRGDVTGLLIYFFLFLGSRIFNAFLEYEVNKAREWVSGHVMIRLDERMTELLFEKSLGQHIQEGSAFSSGNLDKGRYQIWNLITLLVFQFSPVTFSFATSYIALWILSPVIGGIVTSAVIVFLIWLVWLNTKTLVECIPIEADFRALNRKRIERWEQVERVKLRNQERAEIEEMNEKFQSLLKRDRHFWIWFGKQITLREVAMTVAVSLMILYAMMQSRTGGWGVALLFPIFSWSIRLASSLEEIGRTERQISWSMPSIRSLIQTVMIPAEINASPDNAHVLANDEPISIEFKDVGYRYPKSEKKEGVSTESGAATLGGVNFHIAPGEKVALIGKSGAGKTTIMRLLLRMMDPTSGSILINGRDLREIDLASFWEQIAYIPQHPRLFDGTIRENLVYGLKKEDIPSDEELMQVLSRLGLNDTARFSKGLDTVVGRNGIKLSGGQLQRIIIGAAIVQRPKFLVIDEATSHLDSTTERDVQDSLSSVLTPSVGALIIAHRLSTVEGVCSKYIVLRPSSSDEGEAQIEAMGSSLAELRDTSPTLRRLAEHQRLVA